MLSDLRYRLRALLDREALERDLDAELRFHVERETEKLVAAGMSRADAARQAALLFGGMNRIKDDARDARGVAVVDSLRQDLAYAWRGLRARPGFAAAVIVALAVGIGANATMFSVVDRLLFRPPPYLATPDRVHRVYLHLTQPEGAQTFRTMEYPRYTDLTRWTTSFDRTGVIAYRTMAVGRDDDARDLTVAAMSGTMFDFFAMRPALGRFFSPAEDIPPMGTPVVVLSWNYWQSQFGGAADVLDRPLRVGTQHYRIIGVAPRNFVGIIDGRAPVAFVPVTSVAGQRRTDYPTKYNWSWLEMFARRKAGVSVAAANADLATAYKRSYTASAAAGGAAEKVAARKPEAMAGSVHLARGPEATPESRVFTWVLGVAAIVLLIACANVANLLLARAVTRGREIALRMALGVSRWRLVQQLAVESLLTAALGGAAGVGLAYFGAGVLRPFITTDDTVGNLAIQPRTLLFAGGLTLLVAIATGLAPLLHAMRADINEALKATARGVSARLSPARTGLLILQGALSVLLLIGAGLFVRSLWNLRTMRMGYDVGPIVYVEASLSALKLTQAENTALAQRMVDAAAATPGVTGATLAASVPFWGNLSYGAPIVPGHDSLDHFGRFLTQAGSPSYFSVTGTRILAGRGFLPSDRKESQRVVVVSQRLADIVWPGQNPLGKTFMVNEDSMRTVTVVGVAENMRARLIDEKDEIWYYLPISQLPDADPMLLARVSGDPAVAVEDLRSSMAPVLPAGAYVNVTPLQTMVARQGRSWELGAKMFVGLGAIALILAAIGLYSVVAYVVAQRTRELGVRIALGATTMDIIRVVLAHGVNFALLGVTIGSAIALWASRWVEPLLFEQPARDPAIFAGAAVILVLVAVVASARPAARAARLNPAKILQSD